MTKEEYDQFHDLDGKTIDGDIAFSEKKNHPSILTSDRLRISNSLKIRAELEIHYYPEDDSKVFVVLIHGVGAVCRLCVDNGPHGLGEEFPSSHKHALVTEDCPKQNLKRGVHCRSDLDGKSLMESFGSFLPSHEDQAQRQDSIDDDWRLKVCDDR